MRKGSKAAQLQQEVAAKKKKLNEESSKGVELPSFAAPAPAAERTMGSVATGLLTVEEFKKKRELMVLEGAKKKQKHAAVEKKQNKRKALKRKALMSFGDEDEDDEAEAAVGLVTKDPTVETSFLPDKAREEEEERLRAELAEKWQQEQDKIKDETLVMSFSYWDGKGVRRAARVRKGDTIGAFLSQVKETIEDIRHVGTSDLLFVKEDTIIPHHFTFYELLTTRAINAKTGRLLFDLDVDRNAALRLQEATAVQQDHPAKVCLRRWYESNKHIFPASLWEMYAGAHEADAKLT